MSKQAYIAQIRWNFWLALGLAALLVADEVEGLLGERGEDGRGIGARHIFVSEREHQISFHFNDSSFLSKAK